MGVTALEPGGVVRHVVESLGFDPERYDLSSGEVRAALLRRAASFRCPIDARRLVRVVADAIENLATEGDSLESELHEMLDSLVAHGDLYETEYPEDSLNGAARLLRLGPARYVPVSGGTFLLLGVRPDGATLVEGDLARSVVHRNHVRLLLGQAAQGPVTNRDLESQGLTRIAPSQWLRHPDEVAAQDLTKQYDAHLAAAVPCPDIPGLQIVDPRTSVLYYRGRWRSVRPQDSGRFVARRPQAFGSGLWCYVEVSNGEVVRVLDLPAREQWRRAADEAWWLQAAIDSSLGRPQRLRVGPIDQYERSFDFFSPVPSWLQRQLDVVGRPIPRSRGALFSYSVPASEENEALEFIRTLMWMELSDESAKRAE
ncbi:MAG: hypothetical protein AB7N24_11615 [Dehalococcoidia bacterium]